MGDFTPAKANTHADLHAVFNPFTRIANLEAEVMIVRLGPQLNFFDFDILLLLASLAFATLLFVLELAVIHNAAHWRVGVARHFNQVQTFGLSHFQGISERNDADIFVCVVNEADFARSNLVIDAVL